MSMIVWLVLVFFFGLVALPVGALLVGPVLPLAIRNVLGKIWLKLAMESWGRAMLVQRENGSMEMLPSSYDGEKEAEKVKLDGEEKYFEDTLGVMGSLARRKFGIAVEKPAAILSPALAAVAEDEVQKVADGGHEQRIAVEGGEYVLAYNPFTKLRDRERVVDMRKIQDILSRAGSSDLPLRIQKQTLASQSGFSRNEALITVGAVLLGVVTGFVLAYVAMGGGGGGGGPNINLPISMLAGLGVL